MRLSLIWTHTYLDLLRDGVPETAPMRFLGRASTFASRFAALPAPGIKSAQLSVPWPRPSGHYFWTYYLEGKRPGDLTGEQAWKQGVPFRGPALATLSAATTNERVLVEAFYYPHG